MKKTKMEKGITLIALILTIILLVILAVVALNAASGEDIIEKADGAVDTYVIGQEKEEIQLGLNEWKLAKYQGEKQTFKAFMISRLSGKANVDGAEAGPLTVIYTATNNTYEVTDEEIILGAKKIEIEPASLVLELGGTENINVIGFCGVDVTKTNYEVTAGQDIITVNGTGAQATVTAGETAGEATITATCGECTATCTVTVKEAEPEVISIAGTYGYVADTSEANYYIFNEGTVEEGIQSGTGTHVHWDGSPRAEVQDAFNYTVSTENIVTINYGEGEDEETHTFEAKKDSSGNVINKVLYWGALYTFEWENGETYNGETVSFYEAIFTTEGSNGFEKLGTKTYTVVDTSGVSSVSFAGNQMTITENSGATEVNSDYILIGKIVYSFWGEEKTGIYQPHVIIWNENHAEITGS